MGTSSSPPNPRLTEWNMVLMFLTSFFSIGTNGHSVGTNLMTSFVFFSNFGKEAETVGNCVPKPVGGRVEDSRNFSIVYKNTFIGDIVSVEENIYVVECLFPDEGEALFNGLKKNKSNEKYY